MDIRVPIQKALGALTEKQRTVVTRRYGLGGEAPMTLESIGKEMKLTRERIRQIENSALAVLREPAVSSSFDPVVALATEHLESQGGIRQENVFLDEVVHLAGLETERREIVQAMFEFVFAIRNVPLRLEEDKKYFAARYLRKSDLAKAKDFLSSLERVSRKAGSPMDGDGFAQALLLAMKESQVKNEAVAAIYLGISKQFKFNPYGDFGLRQWQEIQPRGVREKAYLVMKKHGKPMHFGDISGKINNMRFDEKVAQPQTVHNELIKDTRFVLCGRGIYGLREWGMEPGTVKEVIVRILKKRGPLAPDQVVNLVKEQRQVKDTTILLGLQDRGSFRRLEDGRYHVRAA